MNADGFSIKQLLGMAHSPVRNYAIPGLTSWLIGECSPKGTIRLFGLWFDANSQQFVSAHGDEPLSLYNHPEH